ncbi:MAG: FxsA family protein, partial [Pseudomonadota bacterium]
MLRLILFLALVGIPIAEISLFLVIGGEIGVLPTIAIIILTALIGAILLRRQGAAALAALQRDLHRGEVPAAAIGH